MPKKKISDRGSKQSKIYGIFLIFREEGTFILLRVSWLLSACFASSTKRWPNKNEGTTLPSPLKFKASVLLHTHLLIFRPIDLGCPLCVFVFDKICQSLSIDSIPYLIYLGWLIIGKGCACAKRTSFSACFSIKKLSTKR